MAGLTQSLNDAVPAMPVEDTATARRRERDRLRKRRYRIRQRELIKAGDPTAIARREAELGKKCEHQALQRQRNAEPARKHREAKRLKEAQQRAANAPQAQAHRERNKWGKSKRQSRKRRALMQADQEEFDNVHRALQEAGVTWDEVEAAPEKCPRAAEWLEWGRVRRQQIHDLLKWIEVQNRAERKFMQCSESA